MHGRASRSEGRGTRRGLFVCLGLMASGCIAPVAAPPLETTVSVGRASGASVATAGRETGRTEARVLDVRTTFQPAQVADRAQARRYDIGLGYFVQLDDEDELDFLRHGPYLDIGYNPWLRRRKRGGALRLSVHGSAELVLDTAEEMRLGAGGSLAATFEAVGHGRGAFAFGDSGVAVAGAATGEASVGLTVAVAYRVLEGEGWWTTTAGFTVRTPAFAAIAVGIPKRF